MMAGTLHNLNHEAFAQHVAEGDKLVDAYDKVMGKRDRSQACKWRARPDISARIEQLLGASAQQAAISRKRLTQMFLEAYEKAVGHKQMSAAVGAASALAKMYGYNEPEEVDGALSLTVQTGVPNKDD